MPDCTSKEETSRTDPVDGLRAAINCELPYCNERFVPKTDTQRFCSTEHRALHWKATTKAGVAFQTEYREFVLKTLEGE